LKCADISVLKASEAIDAKFEPDLRNCLGECDAGETNHNGDNEQTFRVSVLSGGSYVLFCTHGITSGVILRARGLNLLDGQGNDRKRSETWRDSSGS
jgi:hypothetical protein